eukprot:TRINITY_DN2813_c0_g1_i3.p1 TRINITY_DN2813_c0_g1~~TRINITY_DN2813_c0_g1_i3.p1  ORF type:complete len:855 (-),score=168.53 TRINITY_DN2813_c0_g1_i3:344-2908(-)
MDSVETDDGFVEFEDAVASVHDRVHEEEDDVEESFEIVDYTVASPWEKFISRIEESIRTWVAVGQSASPKTVEMIPFDHQSYQLAYHDFSTLDLGGSRSHYVSMLDASQDLIPPCHVIQHYFGLDRFIILSPASGTDAEPDDVCLLLSSLRIALSNIQCEIPCFVPVRDVSNKSFVGYASCGAYSTRFEADSSYSAPPSLTHLSGLTDLLVTRAASHHQQELKVTVSAKLRYMLSFSSSTARDSWRGAWIKTKDLTDTSSVEEEYINPGSWFVSTPWGPKQDPIEALQVSAIWSEFREDELIDNTSFSHLKPASAPQWMIQVSHASNIDPLAYAYSRSFRKLVVTMKEIEALQSFIVLPPNGIPSNPTAEWTSAALKTISASIQSTKLPSAEDINAVLQDMFDNQAVATSVKKSMSIKATDPGSLVTLIAHYMSDMPGVIAMSFLWKEIVHEMRWHWENSIPIPRVTPGLPDTRHNLLSQKLQMLNCCIEERRKASERERDRKPSDEEENVAEDAPASDANIGKVDADSETDGWDLEDNLEASQLSVSTTDPSLVTAIVGTNEIETPVGIKSVIPGALLLKTGTPMHEPVTQSCPPMTEDMIVQQQEIFALLGSSEEATNYRARLQSASLSSDMQAFKAANPGSMLEDFVRWHSPRDWIVDEDGSNGDELDSGVAENQPRTVVHGRLSQRMQQPGNLWQTLWEESAPIPAEKQAALYDYTKEAEAVLDYFETVNPSELMEQLALVMLSDFCFIMRASNASNVPIAKQSLDTLRKSIEPLSMLSQTQRLPEYVVLGDLMESVERIFSHVSSLQKKFPYETDIVPILSEQPFYLTKCEKEHHAVSALISSHKGTGL